MGLGEAVGTGDQHQSPLPEILLLVVLCQAGPQIAHQHIDANLAALLHGQEVGHQAAGYFNDLHDAGCDLGAANTVGLAAGQEDLDCLGCMAHAALASGSSPRTSIWPVTAAEIRAERRSWRRAAAASASHLSRSMRRRVDSISARISICS